MNWLLKKYIAPRASNTPEWGAPSVDYSAMTGAGRAVGPSPDLTRILALPRRTIPSPDTLQEYARTLKVEFGKAVVKCECVSRFGRPCCENLLPVQAWALWESRESNGILGPIKVGGGKSLLDILTPVVVGAKVAVLLLPPTLKTQMINSDWHYYGQHWKLPNLAGDRFYHPNLPMLHVVAFSELSGARATDLFDRLQPDVFVIDEAHNLKNRKAVRTSRFIAAMAKRKSARVFCWSGTLASKSLLDYAHLSAFALKENSPTPLSPSTAEEWASHLDPIDARAPAGELARFGTSPDAREGFSNRLTETMGVICSLDSDDVNASLICQERPIKTPEKITSLINDVVKLWQRPDGEELVDQFSVYRVLSELSCGFFYRWTWPRGEPKEVINRWLESRKNWNREVRSKLSNPQPHLDSPLLLARAAIRFFDGYEHTHYGPNGEVVSREKIPPRTSTGPLPTWHAKHWLEWKAARDTAKPETEPVWVDDFLVLDTLDWLEDAPAGLVWYEHRAFCERVLSYSPPRLFFIPPGEEGDQKLLLLKGREKCILSRKSHGTGKHLQMFSRSLISTPPDGGDQLEQLLGRTHRRGQQADEVVFDFYRHTDIFKKTIDRAKDRSYASEATLRSRQKTNLATWTF